ncbi:MAG TPA: bifunctional diguanylate cyclase/phosphodiesterase, partial [Mycobacteriales bacterium]|nr:bifunctional diguanylate cyclase/phosphodiesterase [Mycobacteriales bacterium]
MTRERFRLVAAATAGAVLAVVGVAAAGTLPRDDATTAVDVAQVLAAALAAACCGRTGWRSAGPERRWRLLVALGIGVWGIVQAVRTWARLAGADLASPSVADASQLALAAFVLPALAVFATEGGRLPPRPVPRDDDVETGRSVPVLVLDGLVVVGSLLTLAWSSTLGAAVDSAGERPVDLLVALVDPVVDLALITVVVLLTAVRRVRWRPPLLLLGPGVVAIAVSDSIAGWLQHRGTAAVHPLVEAGAVAGLVLAALAALVPEPPPGSPARRRTALPAWAHLLVPYLPLTAVGLLITGQTAAGVRLDPVEIYAGMLVMVLVLARQLLTLRENLTLLQRVRDGRRQLAHLAFHDPLTGLVNRALFGDRLAHAVELHRRDGQPVALLFCDLDDFKTVNDSLGHAAGDELLRQVAQRLAGAVRSSDTVARLGGDEFAVLFEGGRADRSVVVERLVRALQRPFVLDGAARTVRCSLGLVAADEPGPEVSPDLLLHQADGAMYEAKRQGGGQVVTYRPGETPTHTDPDLPERLARALRRGVSASGDSGADDGLRVHYQPIVRIADGTTVALEALARWTDRARGPVPPDVFVAVAERTGLVGELDDRVLEQACRDLAGLRKKLGRGLAVHVNVSATRLHDPNLERTVCSALERHGLPGGALVLEITETSRVPDPDAASRILQRLRNAGVRVALDDFGTGYGTLAHLHLLPVDVVKLDRTLTTPDPEQAERLRRSVVTISRALGMLVVAEGVETTRQAAGLHRLGCDLGQGWLYGRPVAVPDLRL